MGPPPPTKILAVHLNFRGRAEQRGRIPDVPSYFLKPVSSLGRDGDPITRPAGAELLVFEGEIAVILGTGARRVTPEAGASHIGWIAPANDAGVYDLRWADRGSNVLSKGQDGFTPIGEPVAVDGLDLDALTLRTTVNGEMVQEDTTANLLFPFGFLIADLSRYLTLEPGDIILTGTPAGSRPVEPGDVVEVTIDQVGSVRNPIVESPAAAAPFGAQPRVSAAVRADAWSVAAPRTVELSPEAKDKLRRVSTATLTVQLRKRGVRNTFLQGLRPTRPDLRMVGYATTLRYVAMREDVVAADTAPLNEQKLAIETIGPDEVLVMDARREAGAGTIGDILATRALQRGAAGIVSDGGVRDSPAFAGIDIPTYYQAPHAAVLGLLHYPLERNVPVTCAGVLVMPGDVLVGDAEGVVVLPAAMAEEVAHDAAAQEEEEAWALERIQAGDSIREVYPMHPSRRDEFETWKQTRKDTP